MLVWDKKDPDEVVIRGVDWRRHRSWIDGDNITSANATLGTANGLVIDADDHDDRTLQFVTLSGGTAEARGTVVCSVVTTTGQTLTQTATILIRED